MSLIVFSDLIVQVAIASIFFFLSFFFFCVCLGVSMGSEGGLLLPVGRVYTPMPGWSASLRCQQALLSRGSEAEFSSEGSALPRSTERPYTFQPPGAAV